MAKNTAAFEKLKAPNQPTTYTQEQVEEIVKCAKDPIWFMERFVYIQHPLHGKLQFTAYPFQRDLINTYWQNRNTIAMIPRQAGKCCINATLVTIKNNSTGKIFDIPIGTYYEYMYCLQHGSTLPDITQYERI